MVAVRTVLVVLVLLGVGLAGCIGKDDDGKASVKLGNVTNTSTFTQPPDGRAGAISAFNETNVTVAGGEGMAHHHDYWQGKTRQTVFTGRVEMQPGLSPSNSAI